MSNSELLAQLIYTSVMKTEGAQLAQEIEVIVEAARRHNAKVGITGCLLISGKRIIQLLEGPPEAIETLYARIEQDQRHDDVYRLFDRETNVRESPNWDMGLCNLTRTARSTEDIKRIFNVSTEVFKFHLDDFRMLLESYLNEVD